MYPPFLNETLTYLIPYISNRAKLEKILNEIVSDHLSKEELLDKLKNLKIEDTSLKTDIRILINDLEKIKK